ncbi:MAG TPA: hypothetical protein VJ779_13770 [Acetobacteraceae bacterium]|nr:hypothetical protein [Acetobacteraceae bacterium]
MSTSSGWLMANATMPGEMIVVRTLYGLAPCLSWRPLSAAQA